MEIKNSIVLTIGEMLAFAKDNPNGIYKGISLSGCGSWRGAYDQPCLFMRPFGELKKQELIEACEKLLSETFYGYKGGEYQYKMHDVLNIEESYSCWSDGECMSECIKAAPDFWNDFIEFSSGHE